MLDERELHLYMVIPSLCSLIFMFLRFYFFIFWVWGGGRFEVHDTYQGDHKKYIPPKFVVESF